MTGMQDRKSSIPDSKKYAIIQSFITRLDKLTNAKASEFEEAALALLNWIDKKDAGEKRSARSHVLVKERKAVLFAYNRANSLRSAREERNITKRAYREGTADAVQLLQASIKRLGTRAETLKNKIIDVPDASEATVETTPEKPVVAPRRSVKLVGFEDLQKEFKAQQEADAKAERDALKAQQEIIKKPAYVPPEAEDDKLAAQSLLVIGRFEGERAKIINKTSVLKEGRSFVHIVASIMVRMESALPNELTMAKIKTHNIGGGFYILENQHLYCFAGDFNLQAFEGFKMLKEDYYFTESMIPAKEIRWFVPNYLYKYMRDVRFSAIAFPWSKKWEAPVDDTASKSKHAPISLKAKREIVSAVALTTPTMVELENKITEYNSRVTKHEETLLELRGAHSKIATLIEEKTEGRSQIVNALARLRSDREVAKLRESTATLNAEIIAERENLKMTKRTQGVLVRERNKLLEQETLRLLNRARLISDEGKLDGNEETFRAALTAENVVKNKVKG